MNLSIKNSYRLNQHFYASLGEKKAFRFSPMPGNMIVLKIVGYAEKVAQYYKLKTLRHTSGLLHQRYPTKGRVWHPAAPIPLSACMKPGT